MQPFMIMVLSRCYGGLWDVRAGDLIPPFYRGNL